MNSNNTSLLDITKEKLVELRADLALLQLRLALKKFNPSEPRWPAGSRDGGRWRPVGGDVAQQDGIYDPSRESMCLAQQVLDEELCRMARSNKCWESSQNRYNNCMKNVYIPPLEVGR